MAGEYSTQLSFDYLSRLVAAFDQLAELQVAHPKVRDRIILSSAFVEISESLAASTIEIVFLSIELG